MSRVPKYRRHPNGQAFLQYQGKRRYLGKYGSPESRKKYREWLQRIELDREVLAVPMSDTPTVDEVVLAYVRWAKTYYADEERKPTKEYSGIVEATRPLAALFGSEFAMLFGPKKLMALQAAMAKRYCRNTTNAHVGRIRRLFRWASKQEIVPPSLYHGLLAVDSLQRGKSTARETEEVQPVPREQIELLLPFLTPVVRTMVLVQYLCGMRPQDVCRMRPIDLDRSGPIWLYTPPKHKNAWRGHKLIKAIPAPAQQLLEPYLDREPERHCFSAQESERQRLDARSAAAGTNRKTPCYPCERRARAKKRAATQRSPKANPYFSVRSYGQALGYAQTKAAKAGLAVEPWSPNQLRHAISTDLSRLEGIQAAQRWLGHKSVSTTEIYSKRTTQELVAVAAQVESLWQAQKLAGAASGAG